MEVSNLSHDVDIQADPGVVMLKEQCQTALENLLKEKPFDWSYNELLCFTVHNQKTDLLGLVERAKGEYDQSMEAVKNFLRSSRDTSIRDASEANEQSATPNIPSISKPPIYPMSPV